MQKKSFTVIVFVPPLSSQVKARWFAVKDEDCEYETSWMKIPVCLTRTAHYLRSDAHHFLCLLCGAGNEIPLRPSSIQKNSIDLSDSSQHLGSYPRSKHRRCVQQHRPTVLFCRTSETLGSHNMKKLSRVNEEFKINQSQKETPGLTLSVIFLLLRLLVCLLHPQNVAWGNCSCLFLSGDTASCVCRPVSESFGDRTREMAQAWWIFPPLVNCQSFGSTHFALLSPLRIQTSGLGIPT